MMKGHHLISTAVSPPGLLTRPAGFTLMLSIKGKSGLPITCTRPIPCQFRRGHCLCLRARQASIPATRHGLVYVHSGSALSPLDEAGRRGSKGKGGQAHTHSLAGQLTTGIHFHLRATYYKGGRRQKKKKRWAAAMLGWALPWRGRAGEKAPRVPRVRKLIYHGRVRGRRTLGLLCVCACALLFAPSCWVQQMSLFLFQEHPHTHRQHSHAITHTHIHIHTPWFVHAAGTTGACSTYLALPCPAYGCCMLPSGCCGQAGQSTGGQTRTK